MLLDGNSLTYRAFFALPTDMATAGGQVTNAVFGFTSMLINLLRDHQPDAIAVAWDRPEPTFRHERYDQYKAQRDQAPDILRQQLQLVRQVLDAVKITQIESPGDEADDIIATLATAGRDRGDEVIVVTGDRDSYQLVEDPHIKVLYNRRGVSDYVLYDEAGIADRTGVKPIDYVTYAALRGDNSDNLPGVHGVGEKTAAKLVNEHRTIDGIYAALDDCTPKLRENLAGSEEQVRLNAELMLLRRDVDLEVSLDDLDRRPHDAETVRELFNFLEFRTLVDRLAEVVGDDALRSTDAVGALDIDVATVADVDAAVAAIGDLVAASDAPLALAASWRGDPGRSALVGLALVIDVDDGQVLHLGEDLLADHKVVTSLAQAFGAGGRRVATHRAKELMRSFLPLGIDVVGLHTDTAVAAYLLDPADGRYDLADLAERYAGVEVRSPDAAPDGQLDFGEEDGPSIGERLGRDALAVAHLVARLAESMDQLGVRALHDDVEVPLVRVLARMEHIGVGVDAAYLRELNDELIDEIERLRNEIWEHAGGEFNVNSTPQLREVLFDRLGLAPQKKTKTGYSTDQQTLEKLRDEHPIVAALLRYREVEKLRSTYGEALAAEVTADGRIHASFSQIVARTGRLSSERPNLHNIPVRSDEGRRFRRAFVPADGFVLLVADYNQIELRVIAHLAEDPGLIDAFESGTDIHTATAAQVFGVKPGDVDTAQRSKAKMVSYGLAYGMEAYGLSQRLNIAVPEAKEILDAYFEAFPNVADYMERTVAEARERGYTETLFGRRRPIPELSSGNRAVRQAGERQAMNAGIQGLAADIFKVALVRLDAALESRDAASRLILQVHDEVLLEVTPAERDGIAALTVDTMRDAAHLRVPLEVNVSWGESWADAKG